MLKFHLYRLMLGRRLHLIWAQAMRAFLATCDASAVCLRAAMARVPSRVELSSPLSAISETICEIDVTELTWQWGYPFGLALIALSAFIPFAWFKWRGWI